MNPGLHEFIKLIEDQAFFNFTGKIVIQERKTTQNLGTIFFNEGQLLNCLYQERRGERSFYQVALDFSKGILRGVVEPEMNSYQGPLIILPVSKLLFKANEIIKDYLHSLPQAPPPGTNLQPSAQIFGAEITLSDLEFKVLCSLAQSTKVEDIAKNTDLLDHEIIRSLLSLRKKKCLKVIGRDHEISTAQ